jgi:predicted homoserine dehydrogenase-like protein
MGGPVCEVLTVAKRNLKAGEILDGVGGFMTYGVIENASVASAKDLLPMGFSEGCRLLHDIPKDDVITLSDAERHPGRLIDIIASTERSGSVLYLPKIHI